MGALDRLKYAQWVMERNLQWIAASDVKTAVIVTVSTGMLGALAATFSATPVSCHGFLANLSTIVAAGCLAFAIFCAAMTVFPRISGPSTSNIFAVAIAKQSLLEYSDKFKKASDEELLADCLAQIHRNADIATQKFSWVRAGITSGLFGIFPWVLALAALYNK